MPLKKKARFISVTVLAFFLLVISVPLTSAIPQLPNQFWGTVTVSGLPAPYGLIVSARIGGVEYASTTTSGGRYGVIVQGGVNGETVEFYVAGVKAVETATFSVGGVTKLNLTVVDNTAPTVTLPAHTPDPENDNTPTYSGTATDALTNVVDIEYKVDSGTWTDVDAFTPALSVSFTFTTTPALADGTHTIYVKAKDNAGNWSTPVSDTLTVITVAPPPPPPEDNTPPPAPSLVSPANGANITDNTPPPAPSLVSPANGANITDNTPTLDWSDVSDPSGVTCDMSIARDAGFVSIAIQKTGLAVSTYELAPAEALAAGTYYWRARAVDGVGNIGSWSENWSFTVSIAPPTPPSVEIPLITPESPATVEVENAAITELEISVLNTVENVRITVQELVDMPAEIAIAAPGAIYRYLEIVKENITDNDISSVTITFRVEKAWIAAQGINENTITLKRYNSENGGWISLPTAKVSEDATYVYFSATSPGLSYFAVSGTAMTPAPAAFTVSALTISPSQVSVWEEVSISVTVKNTGGTVGTCVVTLKINGAVKAIENVTLAGGATELVVFTVAGDKEGTYSVEVNGLAGTFTVITPPIELALPIWIVVTIAIIMIGATIILRRQKLRRILQIG
jgi:PGF-pre-PGF domain-containing protein